MLADGRCDTYLEFCLSKDSIGHQKFESTTNRKCKDSLKVALEQRPVAWHSRDISATLARQKRNISATIWRQNGQQDFYMWQSNLSIKPLKSLNNTEYRQKMTNLKQYRGKTTNLSTIKVSQTNIKEKWQSSQQKMTKLSTINIKENPKALYN